MVQPRSILKGVDGLSNWSGKITSYLLLVILVVILIEVVLRYFFNRPTIWAHELSTLLLGVYLVIPGAYALFHKTHVAVDLLYGRLSLRNRAILDVATSVFFFFWCAVLLWAGTKFAAKSIAAMEQSPSLWSPHVWEIKLMIPLAAFLLLLQGLAKFVRDVYFAAKGKELSG